MELETKEEFCGACVGGAVALVGASVAGYGASSREKEGSRKKILMLSGVITFVISLIIIIYFIMSDCKECR